MQIKKVKNTPHTALVSVAQLPPREVGVPRHRLTYRSAKRNVLRFNEADIPWDTSIHDWFGPAPVAQQYHPPVRENRSKKWD